jgi:WXG100 family type VII secretion target
MGTTTVNTEELHKASRTFQTLSGDYTDIYQSLLNTASTMGVAWESPDNLAFVEQINGFSAELQAMAEHMNASAQALDQQAGNYESVVEAHRTQVQKLAN